MPVWQQELRQAVRDPAELCRLLDIPDEGVVGPTTGFPLRVPHAFVARMRRGDPDDPLLRQVLPITAEQAVIPGYGPDPVGDRDAMATPGLLYKYTGRVLLTVTGACAIHCRYCFRREFPYAAANPRRDDWQQAINRIAEDRSIREVILSGGDPLSLTDPTLARLGHRLAAIPHVDTLRLHTRLPVVLPARVDAALTDWLGAIDLNKVVVIHANHPQEIDAATANALSRLRATGALLLNQAVLLRGVNDNAGALADLSRRLFASAVLPYYLHLLDPVSGTAHFAVADSKAARIMRDLAAQLPGYLVPRLVRETPGDPGKTPIPWEW